ncbi:hypothetical protein OG21DRAFT_1512019 [Imleria badia]|nr:hypothetical protein OG21DRAFT_1512019 [Imleria badia]
MQCDRTSLIYSCYPGPSPDQDLCSVATRPYGPLCSSSPRHPSTFRVVAQVLLTRSVVSLLQFPRVGPRVVHTVLGNILSVNDEVEYTLREFAPETRRIPAFVCHETLRHLCRPVDGLSHLKMGRTVRCIYACYICYALC